MHTKNVDDVSRTARKTPHAVTLPPHRDLNKLLEIEALRSHKITANMCKHLNSDEITIALLEML